MLPGAGIVAAAAFSITLENLFGVGLDGSETSTKDSVLFVTKLNELVTLFRIGFSLSLSYGIEMCNLWLLDRMSFMEHAFVGDRFAEDGADDLGIDKDE